MQWKHGYRLFLPLLLALAPAAPAAVPVAIDGAGESLQQALEQALKEQEFEPAGYDEAELLVVVGPEAFRRALDGDRPVMALHVPRAELLDAWRDGCTCTGLFPETDPALQLRLIRELLPRATRVGLILADESAWAEGYLPGYARRLDLELEVRRIPDRTALGEALAELVPEVDVLLAVTDRELYSAATARQVLLSGYRQNRPVVGPDRRFVDAGSAASIHHAPEALAREAAAILARLRDQGRLPAPDFPEDFSLVLNKQVLETLDLPVGDLERLERRLQVQKREVRP